MEEKFSTTVRLFQLWKVVLTMIFGPMASFAVFFPLLQELSKLPEPYKTIIIILGTILIIGVGVFAVLGWSVAKCRVIVYSDHMRIDLVSFTPFYWIHHLELPFEGNKISGGWDFRTSSAYMIIKHGRSSYFLSAINQAEFTRLNEVLTNLDQIDEIQMG